MHHQEGLFARRTEGQRSIWAQLAPFLGQCFWRDCGGDEGHPAACGIVGHAECMAGLTCTLQLAKN